MSNTDSHATEQSGSASLELSSAARWAFVVAAFAVALTAFLFPLPEHVRTVNELTLTPQGQTTMGILVFALLLWISEAIPFHITGLLGTILIALFGVASFQDVIMIGFGNHIFIFFIGVLVMSSFITRSGLGNRISVYLLSRTGNSTSAIVFGFLVAGMFLSMWITNTAVAAMLMPLGVSILKEEGVQPMKSKFGKGLMIACAWGPIVGGLMAPSGAGPNPIAIGFLKEMVGIELTFVGWMVYGVPAGLLLLFPTWGILMLFFKPEMKRLKKSKEELHAAYETLPPMGREERVTLRLFVVTVVLWLTTPLLERILGTSIPISLPVMVTASVFFFPGVATTTWEKVEREISWSSILLIVSGISLGMVLYRTGAAEWLAIALLGGVGPLHPFVLILIVVLIVEFLKVFLSSNTVTATIVIPIMITLAANLGIDALSITMPAALSTSMAFILVTSTPTNVIPYTAGYFSIRDMAVAGLVMTFVAAPLVAAAIYVIGTFTGLY
ncbi:MAG: DASS family sodium-coupled anion symporter [Spirochaetaceae bacterium]|nr:MAG: DASS family sodium-coupled anion symporter [Spirochaetaceae bacterium]